MVAFPMSAPPLAGTGIAVLVESQYIPGDIRAYQHHFGALGVQVELMSRPWVQPSLTFLSEVEDFFDQEERPPAAPWATTPLPTTVAPLPPCGSSRRPWPLHA